ncbi:3-oxoadipate enol-lactonase [Frankia sp. Cppng1_Ct_nod]|uniref:bifunctional 3-oxoadipate enol-lactonase/4-carboxymuconolactone decarboxylase PcaDC n=1 Tax=Frankia sp. Cppng1_Ct_nod TaxID=2897162 RepID=UPI002024B7D5|nr:3-oxoadipate enol-lactonase [Frankia sp. Cppng1_Ct_nod]
MSSAIRLHHRVDGPVSGSPLLLGPSLGTTLHVWDELVGRLARHHRVLRFDLPGHGGTAADVAGAETGAGAGVADLAELVLELADVYGYSKFAYAGVSLGGAVGAHLGVHRAERLSALALVCSSARFGEPDGWRDRAAVVREQGTAALVGPAAARWFTPAFADRAPDRVRGLLAELTAVDPAGYAACCDALAGYDLRADLGRITVPTLVVAGRDDLATPPAHARELADGIPDATLVEIAHAAHLAGVEQPAAVGRALAAHFGRPVPADDADRHTAGMTVRRAVLGDAHVDRAQAATTSLTADFQDLITRYAWGEIWTRPGLDRRARSCVTLTALVAGGHHTELAMHVRAAVRNGLTRDEIKEVLLQTAIYCGVPAANSAFEVANRTLADLDLDLDPGATTGTTGTTRHPLG